MRRVLLHRPLIAIAALALALGSAVLTATPATADAPPAQLDLPVVTQDTILKVAKGIRAGEPYPDSLEPSLFAIVKEACNFSFDGVDEIWGDQSVITLGSVEGLLLAFTLKEYDNGVGVERTCVSAALAAHSRRATLSGNATLTMRPGSPFVTPVHRTSTLSGSFTLTPALSLPAGQTLDGASMTATGNAAATFAAISTTTTVTTKSTAQKKAAKAKYTKQLKSAKKAYQKALKKAGNNKAKKKTAKNRYTAKKARGKKVYSRAIASTSRSVSKTATQIDNSPFSASALVNLR